MGSKEPGGVVHPVRRSKTDLILDIEAAGIDDRSEKGRRIRQVLDQLPATCKRPSPSGGQHAVLHISDGPAPDSRGGKLIYRLDGMDERGKPRKTLLAEYRGHNSYAAVLGHGRGRLQQDFAPHNVTLAELQAILDELREVSDVSTSKDAVSVTNAGKAAVTAKSEATGSDRATASGEGLAKLPAGPMCDAVANQLDKISKSLANGSRNKAVQGPLVQLVRLGEQGHHGVMEAVTLIEDDFVARVAPDRPGGLAEASGEWSRLLAGAVRIVFPKGITARPTAPCVCLLPALRLAMQQDRYFSANGRAKVTERSVLAHLLNRAEYRQSLLLNVAQRPIAEAIDITQHTVSAVLTRLEKNGWISRQHQRLYNDPDLITLALPICAVTTSPSTSITVDSFVDVVTTPQVHRLFGPMGLGPGVAGTFRTLPEWARRLGHGRLIRVMPGSPSTELLQNPQQGSRRIPAAPPGLGPTVTVSAGKSGKARGTVNKHLKQLRQGGLAFRDDKGRWWRNRFDPDHVADRDGIPHTSELKAARHIRDRRSFFDGLIAQDKARNRPIRIERVSYADGVFYVRTVTGEVLWVDHGAEDKGHPS